MVTTMVAASDLVLLNQSVIEGRLNELELKQYWVAEQLGVAPRTVARWLNGDVKRVRRDMVERLASILEVPVTRLIATDEDEIYASRESQDEVARLFADDSLLKIFNAVHHWSAFEHMIRSVLHPQLPVHHLGMLYAMLCYGKCREGQNDSAIRYGEKALQLGEQHNDPMVIARAAGELAVAYGYLGDFVRAKERFQRLQMVQSALDPDFSMHLALNFSTVWGALGEHDEAMRCIDNAISQFTDHRADDRLASACLIRGAHRVYLEDLEQAAKDLMQALKIGRTLQQKKTISYAYCYLAQVEALQGEISGAEEHFKLAQQGFLAIGLPVGNLLSLVTEAKILSARQQYKDALGKLQQAIDNHHAAAGPVMEAYLHEEIYRLAGKHGDWGMQRKAGVQANKIFNKIGAKKRILPLP